MCPAAERFEMALSMGSAGREMIGMTRKGNRMYKCIKTATVIY